MARFDLATGYPSALLGFAFDAGRVLPRIITSDDYVLLSDHDCTSALERGARRVLGITDELSLVATLTGTIALERCLRVGEFLAQDVRKTSILLLTHENSIDLAQVLVTDRPGWSIRVVGYGPRGPSVEEFAKAIAQLRRTMPEVFLVVLVISPNNPDGGSVSADGWRELSDACATSGAFLVVDHCFLLADAFRNAVVPPVWDSVLAGCNWAAVWDTGKTLNLGGAKFGFVVSDSDDVTRSVVRAVEEIHVVLPRDHSQLITAVLSEDGRFDQFRSRLFSSCRANFYLLENLLGRWLGVRVTGGITFACLHVPEGPRGVAVKIQDALLRCGVAVAASDSFSPTGGAEFVRVSLARDPEYFAPAATELAAGLLNLPASYKL